MCAHVCTSLRLCVLHVVYMLVVRIKTMKACGGTWAGYSAFFFFSFPAWLQMSRGSESPPADDLISTVSPQCAGPSAGGLPSQACGAEGIEGPTGKDLSLCLPLAPPYTSLTPLSCLEMQLAKLFPRSNAQVLAALE